MTYIINYLVVLFAFVFQLFRNMSDYSVVLVDM